MDFLSNQCNESYHDFPCVKQFRIGPVFHLLGFDVLLNLPCDR